MRVSGGSGWGCLVKEGWGGMRGIRMRNRIVLGGLGGNVFGISGKGFGEGIVEWEEMVVVEGREG